MFRNRLRAAAAVLVAALAVAIWMGAPLFSGASGGEGRNGGVQAAAPVPTTQVPQGTSGQSPTPDGARPPAAPPVESPRPAVTAPVADARPAVAPPVAPAEVSKPDARAAAVRDPVKPRARSVAPPVRRAPEPARQTTAVRTAAPRAKAPAAPRYHGSLAVRSEPRGATVSIDGQVVGSTPLLLKSVPAGSRVIRIESEGYARWSSAARVVANQETSIVANLQRGSGH